MHVVYLQDQSPTFGGTIGSDLAHSGTCKKGFNKYTTFHDFCSRYIGDPNGT